MTNPQRITTFPLSSTVFSAEKLLKATVHYPLSTKQYITHSGAFKKLKSQIFPLGVGRDPKISKVLLLFKVRESLLLVEA